MCPLENYVVLIGYKLRQASDENKKNISSRQLFIDPILNFLANILWQTVRKITNEILGMKGLICNCFEKETEMKL